MITTALGTALAAGALVTAGGGAAAGEQPSEVRTGTGWAVANLSAKPTPQTYDVVDVDAEGAVVAARWRPCTQNASGCDDRSYLRISMDRGKTFGEARQVDDVLNSTAVAVAGDRVLTAGSWATSQTGRVVRVSRWAPGTSADVSTYDIPIGAQPSGLRLAASGDRGLLTYRVGTDLMLARTTDGGATWSVPTVVGTTSGPADVDLNGDRAVMASAAEEGAWEVRVSDDAGATWGHGRMLAAASENRAVRVAVAADGRIALAGSHLEGDSHRGDVQTSTDGAMWTERTSLGYLSSREVVDVAADDDAFVASGDGLSLLRSTDGANWPVVAEHRRVVRSPASHQLADTGRTAVAVSEDGMLTMHGSMLMRSFADTHAPSVRLTSVPPAVTRQTNVAIRFAGSDPDAAGAWLKYECAYGGSSGFGECSSPFSMARKAAVMYGSDQYFRVRAIDAAGHVSPTVTARWILDRWAPMNVYAKAKDVVLGPRARFRWGAEEHESKVASYQVRYSVTSQTARRMASWRTTKALTKTTRRSVSLAVPKGRVVCIQVRARDVAGNASAWTRRECAARPYDDRDLIRNGKTRKLTGKRFLDRRATRLYMDSSVRLKGVERKSQVFVVFKRQPGRSSLTVSRPGTRKALVMTNGSTKFRVIREVSAPHQRRAGAIRISPAGTPVVLDGLVVLPRWAW